MDPVLRPLRESDEAEVAEAQRLMALEGFIFVFDYQPGDDFPELVRAAEAQQTATDLPEGRVRATFLVAEVEGRIAGRLSVRHALTDFLREQGGHIGYGVLPAYRGRGVATAMLRHGLQLVSDLGIRRALVTCDDDNAASRRIIEKCGGQYESSFEPPDGSTPKRRYRIDTGPG